jgi:hypothetical protein
MIELHKNSVVRRALTMFLLVAGGCANPGPPSTDAWVGRWTGPEGTYLDINGGDGRYLLIIANLDGPRRCSGEAQAGAIVFDRDGKAWTIHATDGPGTGMKWLMDQTNCLVIAKGEGYCRD